MYNSSKVEENEFQRTKYTVLYSQELYVFNDVLDSHTEIKTLTAGTRLFLAGQRKFSYTKIKSFNCFNNRFILRKPLLRKVKEECDKKEERLIYKRPFSISVSAEINKNSIKA